MRSLTGPESIRGFGRGGLRSCLGGPARREAGVTATRFRRFSETGVAEPVVAQEETRIRRPKRDRRNDWHRSRGLRGAPLTGAPLLELRRARESRAPLSPRRRVPAGVQYTVLCRQLSSFDEHNTVWGSPGNGLPEKCVTATEQAVETPGGGRDRPRTTNVARHRRAASRSGGATNAEHDGRPVRRRTRHRGAAAERGSPPRAFRRTSFSISAPTPVPAQRSHGHFDAQSDDSTPPRTPQQAGEMKGISFSGCSSKRSRGSRPRTRSSGRHSIFSGR
jgi:hypothetical protein